MIVSLFPVNAIWVNSYQQPTARWIFLRFGGIHEYRLGEAPPLVTELTGDQQIILEVLGERYRQIYS